MTESFMYPDPVYRRKVWFISGVGLAMVAATALHHWFEVTALARAALALQQIALIQTQIQSEHGGAYAKDRNFATELIASDTLGALGRCENGGLCNPFGGRIEVTGAGDHVLIRLDGLARGDCRRLQGETLGGRLKPPEGSGADKNCRLQGNALVWSFR